MEPETRVAQWKRKYQEAGGGRETAELFAVGEAQRLAEAGAAASYAVVRGAELYAVDPYVVALRLLQKLLACSRARAAVAALEEGDRA